MFDGLTDPEEALGVWVFLVGQFLLTEGHIEYIMLHFCGVVVETVAELFHRNLRKDALRNRWLYH